jgi:hypothetical protein
MNFNHILTEQNQTSIIHLFSAKLYQRGDELVMKFLQNLRKRKEDKFSEKMDSFSNEEPGKIKKLMSNNKASVKQAPSDKQVGPFLSLLINPGSGDSFRFLTLKLRNFFFLQLLHKLK